jgi:4-hydroxy-tetrahydrodipicolinate reductase
VLGDVFGDARLACPIVATVEEALAAPCDVFFDYTQPAAAKGHVLLALNRRVDVVIGTSGLTDEDYADIAAAAGQQGRAVLAVGNFALTVALLQKFAEIAARYIPHWEIIDYASDAKRDAPSGTAREVAARLSRIRPPELSVPIGQTEGRPDSRGATVAGSQVHSLRLPGYTLSAEVIFGMPDQRLTIRHDAGASAEPYVDGALLAIRKVGSFVGLRRGLDSVMELG